MGTRHLIAVQKNDKYRVAQYGQWDGYPSGQGVVVLEFLRSVDLEQFASKVEAAKWIDDTELAALWESVGAIRGSEFVSTDISDKFDAEFPHLHRNCGAEVLSHIITQPPGISLKDSTDFALDALFCEWAYVIDLDKRKLEVYSGQGKDNKRFPRLKLHHSWKLDALPSKKVFLNKLGESDEKS